MKRKYSIFSPIKKNSGKGQKGMATIETLPLLVIFIMLIGYTLGLWGVVHSAILNSMAARTYAFSTFHNSADLTIFVGNNGISSFDTAQVRIHGIMGENDGSVEAKFDATGRPIAIGRGLASEKNPGNETVHNQDVFRIQTRNRKGGAEVNPVWIKVAYGICLNATCGDGQ